MADLDMPIAHSVHVLPPFRIHLASVDKLRRLRQRDTMEKASPPFDRLRGDLDAAGLSGAWAMPTDPDLPGDKGAYLLAIRIESPLSLDLPRLGAPVLRPGCYAYAGSARGPGGLRARVGRHFRGDKPRRWHIDYLTLAGGPMGALLLPGGDECAIISTCLASGWFTTAVGGFGSSDCLSCDSHLLRHTRDFVE